MCSVCACLSVYLSVYICVHACVHMYFCACICVCRWVSSGLALGYTYSRISVFTHDGSQIAHMIAHMTPVELLMEYRDF